MVSCASIGCSTLGWVKAMATVATVQKDSGLVIWMLHNGRARHPGPVDGEGPPDHLSVEFVNVGGWLNDGDMALDSGAQFLAEDRLIRAEAGSIGHQLQKAGLAGLCRCVSSLLISRLFRIHRWTAEVSCPKATQPVWTACLVDTPDTSASPALKITIQCASGRQSHVRRKQATSILGKSTEDGRSSWLSHAFTILMYWVCETS